MSAEDFSPAPPPPERRVIGWQPDGPYGAEGSLFLACGHVVPGASEEQSAACLRCSLYPPIDRGSEPNDWDRMVERMRRSSARQDAGEASLTTGAETASRPDRRPVGSDLPPRDVGAGEPQPRGFGLPSSDLGKTGDGPADSRGTEPADPTVVEDRGKVRAGHRMASRSASSIASTPRCSICGERCGSYCYGAGSA